MRFEIVIDCYSNVKKFLCNSYTFVQEYKYCIVLTSCLILSSAAIIYTDSISNNIEKEAHKIIAASNHINLYTDIEKYNALKTQYDLLVKEYESCSNYQIISTVCAVVFFFAGGIRCFIYANEAPRMNIEDYNRHYNQLMQFDSNNELMPLNQVAINNNDPEDIINYLAEINNIDVNNSCKPSLLMPFCI
ncbi:MAG: hypothetical protein U1E31_02365 [Rickettsiales bacterium]